MKQMRTVKRKAVISGVGIHTGQKVNLWLKPSSSGRIVFRRTDLDNLEIPLDWRRIETRNGSALVTEKARILTLEHLLAVLYVFGIDSLVVDIDGEEIPICDGSASAFVRCLLEAGIRVLPGKRRSVQILRPFVVEEKEAFVSIMPDEAFRITYSIEYDHPVIGKQEKSFLVHKESFVKEIAPARTFGFLKDVPALRERGLALGGSLENALVLDEKGVINGPLHFPDEFVRHKILDFIGDLSLIGHSLIGHFKARKAGHNLHQKAVRFLLENPKCWSFI